AVDDRIGYGLDAEILEELRPDGEQLAPQALEGILECLYGVVAQDANTGAVHAVVVRAFALRAARAEVRDQLVLGLEQRHPRIRRDHARCSVLVQVLALD